MLVDSHCHLDRLNLDQCGGSLEAAVATANQAGIKHMLCVCISAANKDAVINIAESHRGIYASVGIHPSDVSDENISEATLIQWADHPKVIAIGETGLDYYYTHETRESQLRSFATHLQASKQTQLPTIVHTRDAKEDTLTMIRQHGCLETAGVLHCFTEDWDMAKAALDLNYYISISGIVTFKNASALREVAKKIPADRLLVETDSPYLAPVPYRGKSNQPFYVKAVAEFVAELRGVSFEDLAAQTTDNFFNLFTHAEST